jgi:hypothetical protein
MLGKVSQLPRWVRDGDDPSSLPRPSGDKIPVAMLIASERRPPDRDRVPGLVHSTSVDVLCSKELEIVVPTLSWLPGRTGVALRTPWTLQVLAASFSARCAWERTTAQQKADESLSRTAAAAGVPNLQSFDHNVLSMPHAVEGSPLTFLIDKTPH